MFKVIAAIMLAFGVVLAGGASANAQSQEHIPVTICHRTNAATNPYVVITVDDDAVDGIAGNSGQSPDHYGEHQGPLASDLATAQQLKKDKIDWGDIIPPLDGVHSGQNWTDQGQAIWNNGCNYIEDEEDPLEAVASLSILPATCEAGQKLLYGTVEYADASGDADGTEGPVDYLVTFTAWDEAQFDDQGTKVLEYEGTLTGPSDDPSCEDGEVLGEETPTPVLPTTDNGSSAFVASSIILSVAVIAGAGIRRLLSRDI